MSFEKKSALRTEYRSSVNLVQDFIEKNISEEFSLSQLAKIGNFSPYHFHRIFYMMTQETLFQFIQRVRLEKSAFLLMANKKVPVTKIALECGFANQASFAKAFKNHFKRSASQLRCDGIKEESNLGKVNEDQICYNCNEEISYTVEVKNVSEMNVVYIRYTGPYKQDAMLFNRLFSHLYGWAKEKKLLDDVESKWLTLYHDVDELTEVDKVRLSVCMTAPQGTLVDGEIGKMVIAGGKYAVGHFELDSEGYQAAWNALYDEWLPQSGYQPDDRPCFELYLGHGSNDSGKHPVDIYMPIKTL